MEEKDIKEILQIILERIKEEEFTWRIEGSANLKVQGIDVPIADLDITTDERGIKIFRNALKRFIIKDFFSQKTKGLSLICEINGFEVEINSYGDRKSGMFDKTEEILWNGLLIPILPLEYAKRLYEQVNRKEKVDLISRYLSG